MMKLNNGEKKIRYLKYMMILHMFGAGPQFCISQLNSFIVLPNPCRLIFTTAKSHTKGCIFTGFQRSHPILSTLGPKELSYFFLIKDTKESFASFPVQIHINSTARNFEVYLTGETQRFKQIGRFTLRVVVHKMNPRKSGDQHDTSEGRVFQSAFTCIR